MPEFLKPMVESKLMYSIGSFFVFAQIQSALRSSGAFEVSINDDLVFSKLETGKHIDARRLHEIFEPFGVSFIRTATASGQP